MTYLMLASLPTTSAPRVRPRANLPENRRPALTLITTPTPERPSVAELYARHGGALRRNLSRLGVPSASLDDALQDVFVVVIRHLEKFEPGSSERAWLFAIALRVASDHRRTQRRKRALPFDELSQHAREPSPEAIAARNEELRRIQGALDTMNEDQRAVFLMADVEERTAPEIAEITGAKLPTVYTRLLAARKRLMPQATV